MIFYKISKYSTESHMKKRIKVSRIAKIFENADATQERIYKRQNSWGKSRSPELSFDDVLKEGIPIFSCKEAGLEGQKEVCLSVRVCVCPQN